MQSTTWKSPGLGLTEAVSCVYPTYTTTAKPGETLVLAWQVSAIDRIVYDSLSAELYCMDEIGQWRSAGTVFSDLAVQPPAGEYPIQVPNCGPNAGDGSVKIVAKGGTILRRQMDDSCYFTIQQASAPELLLPPIARPFLPSIIEINPIGPTATPPPPPPPPATSESKQPKVTTDPSTTTIARSPSDPNPSSTENPSTTPPTETSQQSGTGPTNSATVPSYKSNTFNPVGTAPGVGNSGTPTPGSDAVEEENEPVAAIIGGIVAAACLIIVTVLVIMRRRHRGRTMGYPSGTGRKGGLSQMIHAVGVGSPREVMKETKKRLGLGRQPKEGQFHRMDDQDDDDDEDRHMDEKNAASAARTRNSFGRGARTSTVQPALTVPPTAHLVDTSVPRHMRDGSGSSKSKRPKSRSNFETSSAVRKSWTANMKERAERLVSSDRGYHQLSSASSSAAALPMTRDLERGYEEGSIFGDGRSINSSGRDSESRLADIISLRTTGSGAETIGSSLHRRSTLRSMDNSSFGLPHSTATTSTGALSSIPDSLVISEDEFLERLQAYEKQMQLEQEYFDRYYAEHPDGESYHTISRSNSIPSLTSSNDPFKTFDSNEVLVDMDTGLDVDQDMDQDMENPFSDARAESPAPPQQSYHPYSSHPHPHHPYPHRHP
ncbi:hypothetical protein BGX31_002413 [Mortierella sp. GBA43]|nr:hypothetical protein BGX31_002413 [Mortierella sp. GBA43]